VVPMSGTVAWGIVAGLTLGLGLWSLVALVPRLGRPTLASRVAPYIRDVSVEARRRTDRLVAHPLPVIGQAFAPVTRVLADLVIPLFGGAESVERRLRQAGVDRTVASFRLSQLAWAALGAGLGVLVAIAAVSFRSFPPALTIVVPVLFGVGGFVLREHLLQRAAKARLARMSEELPTVLEFLTLSLSAGEGVTDGVRRVARIGHGELARELSRVMAETATGVPFAEAIGRAARELELVPFARFVDQLLGALERGTPLTEVLRAQAQDAREVAKRELLEAAGRKEVAMLVPLVFLILPVTVLFAVFPAVAVIQVGF